MTPAKGYAEMKDSGVEWIGEIPAYWQVKGLFQLVSQVKNKNKDLLETNLLSLSYGKIKRKNIDDNEGLLPTSFDSYNIIEENDIVLRLTDLQNDHTSLRVGRSTERGIITSAYITIRPTNSKMSEYLYYLLHSFDIKKGFYGMGAGVRQGLHYDEVKMLRIPLPTLSEQSAIAAYLDTQCAKIDEIITEAKASIEDYKRWKASIIYEAVTKGLNPNAEMKDSGIEWIGKMPAHWSITRMKSILENVTVKNHPDAEVLSLYRDLGVLPKNSRDDNHNVTSEDTASYKYVEVGDLVINKMKAWQGSLAVSDYEGIVSPAYYVCKFRSEEIDKRYIHFLLRCSAYAQEFERLSTGMRVGQWDLGINDFMRVPTLLPPISEQSAIASYLDTQCAKISELVAEKQSLIDDLESYKKSLIYEAVTGKWRV